MSVFDILLSEYEVTEDTFSVEVPISESYVTLTFRAWRNASAKKSAQREAAKLTQGFPINGVKVTEGPFLAIAHCLPEDAESLARMAIMSLCLVEPQIPLLQMVRLCGNAAFFDFLWSEFQAGQKTVYSKYVALAVEEAKKKSLAEEEDSSSEPSGT